MGRRNPLTDWPQFCLGERYTRYNHAWQIWWRSLKGFRGSCGSNFSISHWLCWSSNLEMFELPNIRVLVSETLSQPLHFKMFRQQRSSKSFIDDTCDARRVAVRLSMLYTSRACCLRLSWHATSHDTVTRRRFASARYKAVFSISWQSVARVHLRHVLVLVLTDTWMNSGNPNFTFWLCDPKTMSLRESFVFAS